jgi:hypothetical protein
MNPVKPNLARIPAAGDARAEAITLRARTAISQSLLDSLDDTDAVALGRHGARQPAIALRQKSHPRLDDALLASALAQLVRPADPRDLMAGMAVHYIVAEQIGAVSSTMSPAASQTDPCLTCSASSAPVRTSPSRPSDGSSSRLPKDPTSYRRDNRHNDV